MSACDLDDLHAYWERVRASPTELQELIEAVVVPGDLVLPRPRGLRGAGPHRRGGMAAAAIRQALLRLLSLPCSTGEEPYSMAMALLDAGFPADRFRIDAVDISARALAHAGRAVYGKNSFRGNDLGFRDRHFDADGGTAIVSATPCAGRCAFSRAICSTPDFLPGAELYDVIFCRNLLIYFDRATQDRAIAVLTRLLTRERRPVRRPSETGLLLESRLRLGASCRWRSPFARRAASAERARPPRRAPAPLPAPPPARAGSRPNRSRPRPADRAAAAPPPPPRARASTRSARLADQGHLAEAARLAKSYLREHGPSAEALHLLGLIRDAAGNPPRPPSCYRKALYLDPNHHEALVHLALLLEKQGDSGRRARCCAIALRRLERSGAA